MDDHAVPGSVPMVDVPVYVISLGAARDRREFVCGEFRRLGVDVEIVDAVDGRHLEQSVRDRYSERRAWMSFGRSLTDIEVAIAMSHLKAYERFLSTGAEEALICEDDVRPTAALLEILARRADLPRDRSVVTMYSMFPSANPTPIDRHEIIRGHRVCRYARLPFGAQCYLVTREAATRLLEVAFPIRLPADHLLFQRLPAALTVYGITPNVIVNEGFNGSFESLSDPEATARAHEGSLSRQLLRVGGAVWRRVGRRVRRQRPSGAGG